MEAQPKRKVEFNLFQMLVGIAEQEFVVAECSRGIGKSSVIGYVLKEAATQLPRGKCAMSGVSAQAMTETLGSTILALERLGWYKDVHYFIGRRSPDPRWPEPFEPPASSKAWTNMIHFFTGFCVVLISQDPGKAEARGHNFDIAIVDEAAQQNERRLGNEVFAALRTWRPEFIGKRMYHKKYFVSSTPVKPEGLWFLKYEEMARTDPKRCLFISADSRFNASNLKPGWVEDQRKNFTNEVQYLAEIRNVRPRLTVNGYYPMLNPDRHYYGARDPAYRANYLTYDATAGDCRMDMDVAPDMPLIMSFDPGAAINVLDVFQMHKHGRELRLVRDFFLPSPSIIQDLIETQVVPWYAPHQRKLVYLFFDRTAYSAKADAKNTTAQIVEGILRRAGWSVVVLARKGVITQHSKFHDIANVMNEGPDRLQDQVLTIRMNKDHARDTTISIERAEAKQNSKNQVVKNKLSEKRAASVPAQHSTHFSDAFDLPVEYYAKVAMNKGAPFMDITMR